MIIGYMHTGKVLHAGKVSTVKILADGTKYTCYAPLCARMSHRSRAVCYLSVVGDKTESDITCKRCQAKLNGGNAVY